MRQSLACFCLLLLLPIGVRAELTETETRLAARVVEGLPAALDLLARSVDVSSATENLEGVRGVSRHYEADLASMGFEARFVPLPPETARAGHLVAERRGTAGRAVLLIGHLDTVLEGEPYRREGDIAFGSGIADMKGGNVVILAALRALHDEGLLEDRRLHVVFTGDEEAPGQPHSTSRAALIEAARQCEIALAYEGGDESTAVVGRRGIGSWRIEVIAETGHSSGIFSEQRGSGAIFEAARILAAFHEELKEPKLTFNPSVIVGGSEIGYDGADNRGSAHGKTNVVPNRVVVEGDLRFLTTAQLEGARERMRQIVSRHLPRTSAEIEFFDSYPPMAPTDGNRALLVELDAVSRDLGYGPVSEFDPGKRGAGDISFVAEYVSGLDGLGAIGERSHAPGESIEIEKLRMQIQRTAILLYRLTR